MNQYASRHNFDAVEAKEPIYFNSAKEAIQHLEECGYWSDPIQFNTPEADEYFFSRYVATDWSQEGTIHYRKRG